VSHCEGIKVLLLNFCEKISSQNSLISIQIFNGLLFFYNAQSCHFLSIFSISFFFIYFIRGAKAPKKKKRHVSNRKVICQQIEIDPF
jgi:hypothetical protein